MKIKMEDFKYRVKLVVKVGEGKNEDGTTTDIVTNKVSRGSFKIVEHAIHSLREKVASVSDVMYGHIEIKGDLTDGKWKRIVYVDMDNLDLQPCIGLKKDIWNLFVPFQSSNAV